jgi:hypothetical protein
VPAFLKFARLWADKSERHRLTPSKNQEQNSGLKDFTKISEWMVLKITFLSA